MVIAYATVTASVSLKIDRSFEAISKVSVVLGILQPVSYSGK
jgi:hypothetical protein